MKVYLAGPMTGLPDHNFPAFHAATQALREAGYDVVSPAEENPVADHSRPEPWAYYIRRDLRVLLDCDAIALLPGWEASRGACLEKSIAEALDFQEVPIP